jgi:hyperosmotically inducible protein
VLRKLFFLLFLCALLGGGWLYLKYRYGGVPQGWRVVLGEGLRDTKTTAAVKAAFSLDRSLKGHEIGVSTEDGVVTLRGQVPSEDAKRQAEEVALAVSGVRQVVSHLRVGAVGAPPPTAEGRSLGESLDDQALVVQVRLALSLRRELAGSDIDVAAFRKEITLTGEVGDVRQRDLAQSVARETAGVAGVVGRLRVRDEGARRGAGAVRRVEQALAANTHLAPYRLVVSEERGRIVLTGRVRSGAEKDLAGLVAQEAAGSPVENRVRVDGP